MSRHSKYAVAVSILLLFVELRAAQPHTTQLKLKTGRPVVETYINGHGPYSFLVDTGTTSKLIISPRLAANLKLKRVGAKRLSDAMQNGVIIGSVVGIDSIEVGGVRFAPCTALVSPLQSPGRRSIFDGILGFDLFRDMLLTMDFRRHKLLLEKGNLPTVADARVIPFQSKNGIPVIRIIINSQAIEAAIDTGATGVMLPETIAKTLQFAETPVLMPRAETLVDQFDVHGATLRGDIHLAAFDFEQPFVAISPAVRIVNLGADVFADFTVTFDEQSGQVRLDSPQILHRLRRKLESDLLEDPPRFHHGVSPTQ